MESAARQRLNVTSGTDEKSPSELEGGVPTNDARSTKALDARDGNGAGDAGKDPTDSTDPTDPPPGLTKRRRFKEFKHRVRGKHLERIPTVLESAVATVRASCGWLFISFYTFSPK
jgi:hypothetical protein